MELTDDDLMRMYRHGDADAFDALFDRYHRSVYGFACSMLNANGAAQDVLQETFLAVARAARDYEPRGRFRSWLFRIARNLCLNRLAVERRRREALDELPVQFCRPPSHRPQPEQLAAANESRELLRGRLLMLPERQREALALYAFEGMKYREIAETLQTPIGTVKTLIHRARAALAQALEDEGHEI